MKQQFHSDLQSIRKDIMELTQRTVKVELHPENVTDKNVQLLAENYAPPSGATKRQPGRST